MNALYLLCYIAVILVFVESSNPPDLPLSFIANGGYVRTAQLPNSNLLSCNGGGGQISIYQKNENNDTYYFLSSVPNPSGSNIGGTDFGNCFLYSSSTISNKVLLAARYHTGCTNVDCLYYSIRVWVSNDDGKTWTGDKGYIVDQLSYSKQSNSNSGLWEPFINEIKMASPYAAEIDSISLNIYYSKEYLDANRAKQQNIIQKTSTNEGIAWGQTVIASASGSRDGMPAVTQFIDGTVLLAMEMSWPINSGHFRNSVIKSYDGGLTYPASSRQFLLSPNAPWQSSASGIAYSNKTGTIIAVSMLDNGLNAGESQYIAYIDSVDGYHWNSFSLVSTKKGFWPNVYSFNDDLYIEFDSGGKSYSTKYPINMVPNEYVAFEYDINLNDQDIGGLYSPLKNVQSSYECHTDCLNLNDEECIAFNWDSTNNNCWLKNGIDRSIIPPVFNNNPTNYSDILSSQWYYGTNTDGVGYKNINNIASKDECLFECLSAGNNCKQVIWNNNDNICYLKSTLPTVYTTFAQDTYLWIVPQLTTLHRGQFVSKTNGDTMTVDKYGMKLYSHDNNALMAQVPRWLVYDGDFTWNFPWGVINMIYTQSTDSWNEHGGGNAVWVRS